MSKTRLPHADEIHIVHEWLKKSRQEWNGPISTWTPEQMDNYHRDLGLLVDFATDCWPHLNDGKPQLNTP